MHGAARDVELPQFVAHRTKRDQQPGIVGHQQGVPCVAHYSGEHDARGSLSNPGQVQRRLTRSHTAPEHTHLDFDKNADFDAG